MSRLKGILTALISLIYYYGVSAQKTCTGPTVKDVIAAEPLTTASATWADKTSNNLILDFREINLTVFIASDDTLKEKPDNFLSTFIDSTVLGMYSLLQGDFSIENITAVPSVNTALGTLANQDYTIKVFKDPDTDQLKFMGRPEEGVGNILKVLKACNGVVYVTDKAIRAAERATQIFPSFNGFFSANDIFVKGNTCNVTLPDAVAALPNTAPWVEAWTESGFTAPLSDNLLASTVFVPVQNVNTTSSGTAAQLYNMLRGEFCPDELVATGSMNSMLGEVTKTNLPLRFEKDAEGNVIVIGAVNRAKVLSKSIGCNSVIITTDRPLLPPTPASVAVPQTLPSKPVRHITCNPIVYLDDGGGPITPPYGLVSAPSNESSSIDSSNSSGGGNSTASAIGLGVGLGIPIIAAIGIAGVLVIRKRRRSNSSTEALGKYPSDVSESKSQQGTGGSFYSLPATEVASSLVTLHVKDITVTSGSLPESRRQSTQLSRLGSTDPAGIDLWEIDPGSVEIVVDERGMPVQLGKGSFGAVYCGMLRGVQRTAIKVLNASVGKEAVLAFQREAAILKHVNRDKNVVQLYGTSKLPDGKLLLLTELMEGGDLRRALNNSDVTEALAWHKAGKGIALDIARGLTSLHAVNVVHRDLKSKNVFLTSGLDAKIGDVGIAAVQTQAGYLTASAGQVLGTLAWSAPELLLGKRCTEKVDIYSFGIVLWELATGNVPQRGFMHSPPPSVRCPVELINLIEQCTDEDAAKRPSAKQAYDIMLTIPPLSQA